MKIRAILQVVEPEDINTTSRTGLTWEAYDRLYDAVVDAGFEWIEGPDQWGDR